MMEIRCGNCKAIYPPSGFHFKCSRCGGLFEIVQFPACNLDEINPYRPGIWKFEQCLGIPAGYEHLSLGEGETPLIWSDFHGRQVGFKCEFVNPSGSFKDRGSAVMMAWLKTRGITEAVEDSSGNAGASLAAYAARGGINVRIVIPKASSGPKRKQMEYYGAEVIPVAGDRDQAAEVTIQMAESGTPYASHAFLPFNLPGYATIAYEIYLQLRREVPGSIILPVGQGGLLQGILQGFEALRIAGYSTRSPHIVAVQSSLCAPIYYLLNPNRMMNQNLKRSTLAEGIGIPKPVRGLAIAEKLQQIKAQVSTVDELEISQGMKELAWRGFHVEPTSAVIWPVIEQQIDTLPEPIIGILTGSGLKYAL
jgi:threonine synthase